MPTNKTGVFGSLRLWQIRFHTMVRYRLLLLTSAPIILTLLALVGITLYWSTHYSWQNALVNVEEKLSVAENSIEILQEKQEQSVAATGQNYYFRQQLEHSLTESDSFKLWMEQTKVKHQLDFLRWVPTSQRSQESPVYVPQTYFEVVDKEILRLIDPRLPNQAHVPLLNGTGLESRGLLSRSIFPVISNEGELLGYLEGGLLLNNSTALVDKIRDLIYPKPNMLQPSKGTVTLFLDDLRISTNVPLDSEDSVGRAIGTRVSAEVRHAVIGEGKLWIDRAYVYDDWYVTAYQPLHDQQGEVIGMLYTGYLIWPLIKVYITNLGEISLTILALLLISGMMVYRGSRDLFQPIERIHHVVKSVQAGRHKRIGQLGLDSQHELMSLASQFDQMLDLLDRRNSEIKQASELLEEKVERRTVKLKHQTEQLELHIKLLHQTRDKLVVSEKLAALGELTAGIAHEINNPTAVILGNVELLKFELGDNADGVEDEIQTILNQIDRIRNITRSLLQYSRQGGIQDEITWQHVNPIVEESLTLVKTGSKKRNITFITELNAKAVVEMNRHQLLQILVNLEMNAIHAMESEGSIILSSEDWLENGDVIGVVVHVTDQGCGIAPERLKRVFDPFYTTKRDGTGLGLSVSQSILSQNGGEITAESESGKGSRFSIYLPLKANHVDILEVG
ncbi:cache domain-containing protein [Vibrio tapetis]|uniref:histidine kinase n=1 Tax=Vibrio tapetis subsp. tapetis TaxID=1671868 RepID=A0A2N8Z9S8_9VIBR|nr:cache domain-containing protein [Vibrio tapetis]SON48668.1 putative Signal transduction histidine kinase [Vibrio tapetis subsp. tapetis]